MYKNARESWTLYDTHLIGSDVNTVFQGAGFSTSYAVLGGRREIPFFNVRNQSVGVQYCNLDSANKLPFVFHAYSIGVSVEAPLIYGDTTLDDFDTGQLNSNIFFNGDIANHIGMIFRVSQDEKLVTTSLLAPDGQGIYGSATLAGPTESAVGISGITNAQSGEPVRENRFTFKTPISMPREVNFDVRLILSTYAQNCLQAMIGPAAIDRDPTGNPCSYPLMSMIRVSLYGYREVQQRNEQHYAG